MNVVTLKPWHLRALPAQPAQIVTAELLTPDYAATLANAGPAITVMRDGQPIACAGVGLGRWNTGTLWAFIGADCGRQFVGIHRIARRFVESMPLRRIEATVEKGFDPGCRWMTMLGFEFEGVLRSFGPDGSDHLRYARVRP